jgi:arabinogalactan endo-1,4-beta-galactosidase
MKSIIFYFLFLLLFSCEKENSSPVNENSLEIKGADMSLLPEIRKSGLTFFNENDKPEDMLLTLKKAGVNVIRLRIWNNPSVTTSDFASVKTLADEIKSNGMKVMLTVHYSDTWADPGKQTKPEKWKSLAFEQLRDSVYQYTKKIMTNINPEYIQIGNEINGGLLWPDGKISNLSQMKQLLQKAVIAVREINKNTRIIIHFAGYKNSDWFYSQLTDLDYDIIGLSYYPIWHGKNLDTLKNTMVRLSDDFGKKIFIAETSYPFTLSWNDATTNIIGSDDQILTEYSATPQGQKNYLQKIKEIVSGIPKGIGFCYWGSEWVSYKGKNSTSGSSYENQALWDFTNSSLPAVEVYK